MAWDSGALAVPVSDQDHVQGAAEAPVTLLVYGDFESRYTRRAVSVVRELQGRLGDELRFVFRNFPLIEIHHHAHAAAEAAEAAGAQGKYWEMHAHLFARQEALADADLRRYALELGLDEPVFREALETHIFARRVDEDVMGGLESGVGGTPAFFINGTRHDGAYDLDTLLAIIRARE
jgi:protein-disulfide isomerase